MNQSAACNCSGACKSGKGCSGGSISSTYDPYNWLHRNPVPCTVVTTTPFITITCCTCGRMGDARKTCETCFPSPKGWMCPNCKKTHSPYINTCPDQIKPLDFKDHSGYGV